MSCSINIYCNLYDRCVVRIGWNFKIMSNKLTQTELGTILGLSSVAIGKKLVEWNLKDKETKLATDYAIKKNLAKNVTYEKYGKNISMTIWNNEAVNYIKNKMSTDYEIIANMLFGKFKKLKKIEDEDDGTKIKQLELEYFYEDFEKDFKIFRNDDNVLSLFYKKLEKDNLLEDIENIELLRDLRVIKNKNDLDNFLQEKSKKEKTKKI